MRRRFGLCVAIGVLLPLTGTSSAWAQGAILEISPQVVSAGTVVTVNGGSFSLNPGRGPVDIRLQTRDGRILFADADLNARGQIENLQFPMPTGANALSPGNYLVLATQTWLGSGRASFGSPARTRIRVVAAGANAASPARPGDPGGPTGLLPALGAVLALILLATGSMLTLGRLRVQRRPSLGN